MLVPMFSSGGRAGRRPGPRLLHRVDPDDVEVEDVAVACVAGERLDPGRLGDVGGVVRGDVAPADLGVLLDLVQLTERDRCEDVREVGLEAGNRCVGRRGSPNRRMRRRFRSASAISSTSVVTIPPSPAATFFVA